MIYKEYILSLLEDDEKKNLVFQFDTVSETMNCYTSVYHFREKHNCSFYLLLGKVDHFVLVSKEPIKEDLNMTVESNVDVRSFLSERRRRGSKYAPVLDSFVQSKDDNRRLTFPNSSRSESAYQCLARLIVTSGQNIKIYKSGQSVVLVKK